MKLHVCHRFSATSSFIIFKWLCFVLGNLLKYLLMLAVGCNYTIRMTVKKFNCQSVTVAWMTRSKGEIRFEADYDIARNRGHYVRTGLDIVGAIYIDIQSKQIIFYDSIRVWYKEHYKLKINDLSSWGFVKYNKFHTVIYLGKVTL